MRHAIYNPLYGPNYHTDDVHSTCKSSNIHNSTLSTIQVPSNLKSSITPYFFPQDSKEKAKAYQPEEAIAFVSFPPPHAPWLSVDVSSALPHSPPGMSWQGSNIVYIARSTPLCRFSRRAWFRSTGLAVIPWRRIVLDSLLSHILWSTLLDIQTVGKSLLPLL